MPSLRWPQNSRPRIFALNFALGVASGIVMEFQFGNELGGLLQVCRGRLRLRTGSGRHLRVLPRVGIPRACLIFGWGQGFGPDAFLCNLDGRPGVPSFPPYGLWLRFRGSRLRPGFVIQGFRHSGGGAKRAELTDFWKVVFNPSAMDRLLHVVLGAFILRVFFRAQHLCVLSSQEPARRSCAQIFHNGARCGGPCIHSHADFRRLPGTNRGALPAGQAHRHRRHIPVNWGRRADSHFRIPDAKSRVVRYNLSEIPGLLSFLAYRDSRKPVPGLDRI